MTTIDPGEGWRLLVVGELIRDDDQCYRPDLKEGPWIQIRTEMGRRYNTYNHYPIRRKKDAKANIANVEVHTGGPYIAIEVHRAALAEIERLKAESAELLETLESRYEIITEKDSEIDLLKAELDAIKQPQPDPEPEWFDLTPFDEHVLRENVDYFLSAIDAGAWKVVRVLDGETVGDIKDCGYTLFRCLLKDAPPELVAKAKQTESPDDWVTINVRRRDLDGIRNALRRLCESPMPPL